MKVLLAVDLSNQCYKAAAVHATLSSEGRFTGGLFGFLGTMSKAILHTGATHIVLCRDMKPYLRSEMYPEYKALRASTKDETLVANVKQTMVQVLELAKLCGWPVWGLSGFESDDLIAHATTKYRNRFERIVAASNDSDLYQLFQYRQFAVWKGNKQGGLYTQANYKRDWDLTTEQLILALSMMGTHNEIAGIPGVGEVTAKKAIHDPAKLRAIKSQHEDLIERNRKLITLPHPDFPTEERIPVTDVKFKDRVFMKYCSMYDISISKAMLDAFGQLS